ICRTSFDSLKAAVVEKLPKLARQFSIRGHAMSSSLVLSISERHATRIFDGSKTVEIRRRFSTGWNQCRAGICAGGALLGEVTIRNVVVGAPADIWERFAREIACSRDEFNSYVAGKTQVYALLLERPIPY